MSSSNYDREQAIAISAVLKACHVAQSTFKKLVNDETVTKKDKSPVTVADYAAQALVSTLLAKHFPEDPLIGEEDANDLRTEEQASVKSKIIELANGALSQSTGTPDDQAPWDAALQGKMPSDEDWLNAIDRGNAQYSSKGRVWALDPIDGTKGFLRGEQYAVCLALMVDGHPVMGVMGTPNLPVDFQASSSSQQGVLFVAQKGKGAFQRTLTSSDLTPIKMASISSTSEASFCESVEAGHSNKGLNKRIAELLGITKKPTQMDSQAKYCSISRGDGNIYLRLPVSETYEEKIWDHASGSLLVEEAGGRVSDMNGKPLDFSKGRTLKENKGVIAAPANLWEEVISKVKQAVEEDKQGKL